MLNKLFLTTAALSIAAIMAAPAQAANTKTGVGKKIVTAIAAVNEYTTVMSNEFRIPQHGDVHADVSIECGLMTETVVRTKGGNKQTSQAEASVMIKVIVEAQDALGNWVEVNNEDGSSKVYPDDAVYFCSRTQELSATLQGQITAACFDEVVVAEGDTQLQFNPDAECLEFEEVGLMLNTLNAAAFNFVVENLDSGDYRVSAEAIIAECPTDANGDSVEVPGACFGTSSETDPTVGGGESDYVSHAWIGKGSMVLDEIMLNNN